MFSQSPQNSTPSRATASREITVRTISEETVAPTASFMERSTRPHQVRKAQSAARGASQSGTSGMSSPPTGGISMQRAANRLIRATSRLMRK